MLTNPNINVGPNYVERFTSQRNFKSQPQIQLQSQVKVTSQGKICNTHLKIFLLSNEMVFDRFTLRKNHISIFTTTEQNVFRCYLWNEQTGKIIRKFKHSYLGMEVVKKFVNQKSNALEIITNTAIYRLLLSNFQFVQMTSISSYSIQEVSYCDISDSYLICHHGGISEMDENFKFKKKWCYSLRMFTKTNFPSIKFLALDCSKNWAIAWSKDELLYIQPNSCSLGSFNDSGTTDNTEIFNAQEAVYLSQKELIVVTLNNSESSTLSRYRNLVRIYKAEMEFDLLYTYAAKENLRYLSYVSERHLIILRHGIDDLLFVKIEDPSSLESSFKESKLKIGKSFYLALEKYLFCKKKIQTNYFNVSILSEVII